MKNPFIKFKDKLPVEEEILELKDWIDSVEDGPSYYLNQEGLYTPEGFISEEELRESHEEWRYHQDDWLFPEEVTGEEDADYWLFYHPTGKTWAHVHDKDFIEEYGSIVDYLILKPFGIVAVRPMKFQQPPKWMIEKYHDSGD
jgi:hypothetical protein